MSQIQKLSYRQFISAKIKVRKTHVLDSDVKLSALWQKSGNSQTKYFFAIFGKNYKG